MTFKPWEHPRDRWQRFRDKNASTRPNGLPDTMSEEDDPSDDPIEALYNSGYDPYRPHEYLTDDTNPETRRIAILESIQMSRSDAEYIIETEPDEEIRLHVLNSYPNQIDDEHLTRIFDGDESDDVKNKALIILAARSNEIKVRDYARDSGYLPSTLLGQEND